MFPHTNTCMAVQVRAVWAGGQDVIAAGLAGGQQLPLAEVVSSLLEWRPLHDHIRYLFLTQGCARSLLSICEGMTVQAVRCHVLSGMSQYLAVWHHMHILHHGVDSCKSCVSPACLNQVAEAVC
jgi:hypothetical protein